MATDTIAMATAGSSLHTILIISQVAVSIILIVLILLQEKSSGVSGIFGGGGGGIYQTRRGLEKIMFILTIIFTSLFALLALTNLVLPTA